MKFLALLAVLLLRQYGHAGDAPWCDRAVARWDAFWRAVPGLPAGLGWALTVVLPAVAAGLLVEVLRPLLWGLFSLLLAVILLLYALGRGDLLQQVEDYLQHWQQGDWQSAWRRAQDFVPADALETAVDAASLHRVVSRAIAYQALERLFAVLFWFLLLGPAGAVLYRLASVRAQQAPAGAGPLDAQLLHLLEWLPVRLLGLLFAFAGNFTTAVQALDAAWFDSHRRSDAFLADAAAGALQWTPLVLADDTDAAAREAFVAQGTADIRSLMTLLARVLIIVVALVSLWQILKAW